LTYCNFHTVPLSCRHAQLVVSRCVSPLQCLLIHVGVLVLLDPDLYVHIDSYESAMIFTLVEGVG